MLIDANLLIYASMRSMPQHQIAAKWLEDALNNNLRVALPWNSLLAFLRITTNARTFEKPLSVKNAWQQVKDWTELDNTWIPVPGKKYTKHLNSIIHYATGKPLLIPDLHLAALAMENGLKIYSADRDFALIKEISWTNPLQ